jgi:uncharacterized protein YbjT (DUF2867 family)
MMNVILTGATGMVGEGVLHECLMHPEVHKVLVLGRRHCGVHHPRLEEIILPALNDLSSIKEKLGGFNACFFCAGVSSVGKKEEAYKALTHTLTLQVASTLVEINRDMVFCYISGASTDSTEKGRVMWARVKGKTENDLLKLPFKKTYLFRPGYMQPTRGLKNTLRFYKYFSWMYPFLRATMPKSVCTLGELGKAMINAVLTGYDKNILEVEDIVRLAMG